MKQITKDFKLVPISEIIKPISGLNDCYKDHWWAVTEQDEVLLYKEHHPQCNINKQMVERIFPYEGCRAVLIPYAFVKVRISDYV